jgi:hypothetical protein
VCTEGTVAQLPSAGSRVIPMAIPRAGGTFVTVSDQVSRPGCQVQTAEFRVVSARMPRFTSDAQAPEGVAPRRGFGPAILASDGCNAPVPTGPANPLLGGHR